MSKEKMFGMFKVRLDSEIPYGEFILTCKSKDELNMFFYSRADLLQLITKLENTLQARIAELTAENAALREHVRWIPVSERLPELQDPCLVIYRSIDAISAIGLRYRQDVLDGYVWIDEDGLASPAGNVTHWMPLPKPPEEQE